MRSLPPALRSISGLTAAALWSSGTSYLLFVLYARDADADTLGTFVAVTTVVLLSSQLLDGGTGLLLVRDVSRETRPEVRAAIIRLAVRRRLAAAALTAPLAVVAVRFAYDVTDAAALATTAGYVLASAVYGLVVQVLQAERRFRALVGVQSANGLLYLAGGAFVVAATDRMTLWSMVAAPAVALAALAVGGGILFRGLMAGRGGKAAELSSRRERIGTRLGSTAVALTANVDQLFLGLVSVTVLAAYAGPQRAALGLAAVSAALASYLLPTVASASPAQRVALLGRSRRLLGPSVVLAAATALAVAIPLGHLYGDENLAQPLILVLLFTAYTVGALSTPAVSVLYAMHKGHLVAALNIGQALVVVVGCALTALAGSAAGTAAVITLGRAAYYAASLIVARRLLRNRNVDATPHRRTLARAAR